MIMSNLYNTKLTRIVFLPGSRKETDRERLQERREQASLYVGETARSISERAGEQWDDAIGGKEESHMLEHQAAPTGRSSPSVQVQGCEEMQVREAVRIYMRGNVLNKVQVNQDGCGH